MKIIHYITFSLMMLGIGCTSNKNTSVKLTNSGAFIDSSKIQKTLQLVYAHPDPVLSKRTEPDEGIEFGFEGGRVVKVNGTYHLFTSEMYKAPIWVKMRLGYWVSNDKINWKRAATIRESSGEFNGKDPRAALWSPLPVWDEENNVWNLFYVAYKAAPNIAEKFLFNHEGRIWRSVSEIKGIEGISGPYKDIEVILEPGPESQSWEGLQGTDSFFPWKVGNTWYAFYGSAKTESKPIEYWRVGFATSNSLAGKWTRMSGRNPAEIEKKGIENPIVSQVSENEWLVVYDHLAESGTIGWGYSEDGINWPNGNFLTVNKTGSEWCKDIRTPLGLVDEGDGKYTIFYSGFEDTPDWNKFMEGDAECSCSIGFIEVEFK